MEDLSRYYTLLKDPTRRKIIEILATQEKIGFKELRQTLGVGTGTVYYHLDMLSTFIMQDKQRKYRLNERGQELYRVLKDGQIPPTLGLSESFSHRVGKWVFLSPIFAKTTRPLKLVPVTLAILVLGAIGSAYSRLDPALFFYLRYSVSSFSWIAGLYIFNWMGLFLFAEFLTYLLYRRVRGDLQLFTCIGIASFPIASFPYIYWALQAFLPELSSAAFDAITQYVLIVLQVWTVLLVSAAFSFGKGIRLDKAFIVSLTAVYVNIAALFLLGRFA